ncbi:MAG: HAMP domain-containing protein [Rhodocyclaceae bacterium]|nr:HAMP domain-containing protein [Rhodocyclaceae bacterium]
MGRLFWKMFIAFWLSLVLAAGGIGAAVWLYKQVDAEEPADIARGGGFVLNSFGSVLQHGGPAAVRRMLEEWEERGRRSQILVFDSAGRELLDRRLPPPEALQARGLELNRLDITTQDGGTYQLVSVAPPRRPGGRGEHERPSPLIPLAAGLLASLAFSGLMAWYLARPVRQLRGALGSLADGRLDTRVSARMGTWRDEISDLGQDFDHMAHRLEALVGSQRRLLHDVSHELRSPLARLQAAIGLARQSPERGAELMERVERESARLDFLVGELLTLARLDAGTQEMPREPLDLFDLAAGVAEDAGFEAEVGGKSLAFDGRGEAPLLADGARLQRAFENVMRNAVKFSPAGGAVQVAAQVAGGRFRLVVSDQGPGVPEGELEEIFEPFFRSGHAAAEGFGLGLAIARRAVESHGGTVAARNGAAGGLVVTIELPVGR